MKSKNLITLELVSVFLIFCFGCNFSDYNKELSGNYFFISESNTDKYIICHNPNGNKIWPHVLSYTYNNDFIIATQYPINDSFRSLLAYEIRSTNKDFEKNSVDDIKKSEKLADSVLNHSTYYQRIFSRKINYWIISHSNDSLYGPLSKEEYLHKRIELKIPENLILNTD